MHRASQVQDHFESRPGRGVHDTVAIDTLECRVDLCSNQLAAILERRPRSGRPVLSASPQAMIALVLWCPVQRGQFIQVVRLIAPEVCIAVAEYQRGRTEIVQLGSELERNIFDQGPFVVVGGNAVNAPQSATRGAQRALRDPFMAGIRDDRYWCCRQLRPETQPERTASSTWTNRAGRLKGTGRSNEEPLHGPRAQCENGATQCGRSGRSHNVTTCRGGCSAAPAPLFDTLVRRFTGSGRLGRFGRLGTFAAPRPVELH